jgi:serine/threonine protein kinase/uncharacterized protein YraI
MEAMVSLEGKLFGHYQILSQVDEGGMATIYKAIDTHLERNVAIKIIRKENFSPNVLEQVLKRFEREAKSLAQLSHPNIVKVIDYGEYENSPYLVMEFLSGGTLKLRLQEKINTYEAVGWLIPISHALAYAHHRGVIHRDVKPSNILFTETNEPMLTDFGIAKILETHSGDSLTGSGVGIGTPEYMAPEQGLGQAVDARTDIYALGIVLYEILTGRRPFQADTPMSIVLKHMNEPMPNPRQFNPTISEFAEQVLIKALAKNPDDRYADMVAFARALSQLASEYPTEPGSRMPFNAVESAAFTTGQAVAGKPEGTGPISEEDTGKLLIRISRLEKVVEESLAAEDFDDAENLISTIEGLGERGRQSGARLRVTLEQARKNALQRDKDISNIRLAFPKALETEDLPKAEAMLLQLKNLGPKGVMLANQFQISIDTSRQQITLRQTEINRLKKLAEQNIAQENFSQAEAFILSLSVIGTQGKAQAARLQEAMEKSQQQVGQRKAQIYRLTGLVEQQITERKWEAARKSLQELEKMGTEGKASAEKLGDTLKKAQGEATFYEPAPVRPPIEQTKTTPPISIPVLPTSIAKVPEKRSIPGLRWIIFGAIFLTLGLLAGGGLVVSLVTRQTPKETVSQGQETPQGKQTPMENQESGLDATQIALTALPTATAAGGILPKPTVTASPPASATVAASLTPTLTPTPPRYELTVDAENANIRTGPGTVYLILASKPRGTLLEAIGRSAAGDWLVVELEDGRIGWISTKVILYSFDANLLPVVQAPPTPIVPTKKPTESNSGGSSGQPSNPPTWTPPPP